MMILFGRDRFRAPAMVLAAGAACWLSSTAVADVYQYSVGRGANYTQTSSAAPTAATAWNFLTTIVAEEPILSAAVTFDRPPVVSYDLLEGNPDTWYFYSPYYATEEEFLENFPATTYTLSADVGAGPATGDAFLPAHDYMEEIPHFTGTTFDRLHAYDATLPFAGTINGFTMPAVAEFGLSIVNLVDASPPTTIWTMELAPGDTGFEIPGGLLLAGHEYSIGVTYYSWAQIDGAGFGDASAIVQFSRGTGFYFTTLRPPCVADCDGNGVLDVRDFSCFQNAFALGDKAKADCNRDGVLDIRDFSCFQNQFALGCP